MSDSDASDGQYGAYGEDAEPEVKEENIQDSDNSDDDDQESGEEEEEEEDPSSDEDQPQTKRAKTSRRRRAGGGFIDDIAHVGEDEDESEDEVDDARRARERRDFEDAPEVERQGRKYFQDMKDRDIEDIAADIEERAKQRDIYQAHHANIEQENLLPSVRDPKLYTIPCKMGAEQDTVIALMNKAVHEEKKGFPLRIKSVFYNPTIRGFVYVESFKESYVEEACKGIRNLIMYRGKNAISAQALRLVPIKEMVHVINATKKSAMLKPGDWVRLKRGTYKGDLAKVVDPDEAQSKALLKIVPRIDLQAIAAKRDAARLKAENPEAYKGSQKRARRSGARPPQRLFNIDDIVAAGGDVQHLAGRVILFSGKRYRDGYLFLEVNLDGIESMSVTPTLDEIQLFEDKTARDPDADPDGPTAPGANALSSLSKKEKRMTVFSKGDVVKVLKGELKNLKGTVVAIKSDSEGQQLVVKPMFEQLKDQELVFTPAEVVKFFKVGDHVEVLAGRHEKETGMVLQVEADFVNVFSDINKKEIKVFASDCRLCEKVASGVDSLGKYVLNDMVMIGTQTVGVIIRIDKESVTLLTNNGVAQEVKHQALGMKKSSRNAVALDQNNNQLAVGDVCKIEQGNNKGKQGSVIHLFRSFVFLHSQDEVKNSGVMVARSRHVALIGGNKRQQMEQQAMMFTNPHTILQSPSAMNGGHYGQRGMPGMGMGGGGKGKGGKGKGKGGLYGNDHLIGQTVTIRTGPNKGLKGVVKNITLMHARIELAAKRKLVNIPIPNQMTGGKISDVLDIAGAQRVPGGMGAVGAINSQFAPPPTPGHTDVMRTPAHVSDPLATPAADDDAWDPDAGRTPAGGDSGWGPGTPSSMGGSTPGWGGTPHDGYTPNYTPNYTPHDGGSTPHGWGTDNNSPRAGFSPGPGTPGFGTTPGAGTPGTPQGYGATPGTFGGAGMGGHDDDNWLLHATGVLVNIVGGPHVNKTGVIRSAEGLQAQVEIPGEMTVSVQMNHMTPIVPSKKDPVVIIADQDQGGKGILIGIDGTDGIVKMNPSLDIKILRLDSLAKLASSD